jgi:hypothetical protein
VANDYPQIVDKSTLTGVFQAGQFMVVGVEGQKDAGGTGLVGLPYLIRTAEDANLYFGTASSLAGLVKFLLARGLTYVMAVASGSGATPILSARQTAWTALEENPDVRIRLTDSMVQADLVALADSCEWAEGIQHKQFCVVGLSGAESKASAITAAGAIASKRAVLVTPGVYDLNGNLLAGNYVAAMVAAEIAKNPDIADSLNNADIPATAGVEKDATTALPIYRLRAGAGTPVNDFQDILTAGGSPLQQSRNGLAAFSHLRTTWTTDTTFDALMTLLIKDEVFLQLRNLLLSESYLRSGNTPNNRSLAAKKVQTWLEGHSDWVQEVPLPDGTVGYGVSSVPSTDLKSFDVAFHGQVLRGTNVININGTLTIPV